MSELRVDPETGEVLDDDETVAEFNEAPDDDAPADDDAPDAQPESVPEPEPDTGPSPEALIKLGRSFDTYAKKVVETYGDDAQALYPCPLCPDNHKGFIDLRSAGQVPNEIAEGVYQYLTATDVGTYEQDPGTKTCPVCSGKTQVRTGALSGQWITRTCPNCGGYGFMPPPTDVVGSKGIGGEGGVVVPLHEDAGPSEDVDEWGEPRVLPDGTLNANFGMMPNRKQVHPVYGVTANLTAQSA